MFGRLLFVVLLTIARMFYFIIRFTPSAKLFAMTIDALTALFFHNSNRSDYALIVFNKNVVAVIIAFAFHKRDFFLPLHCR